MFRGIAAILAILTVMVVPGEGQEADTVTFPTDGIIVSLSVFGPMADDMKEAYGFIPILGVRGLFDAAPRVSMVSGVHLLQWSGRYYPGYTPYLDGESIRLRAVLGEFGLRYSSVPKLGRRMFIEGGTTMAWAGERFKEGNGSIAEKDHTGTGMGFWLGFGAERFLKKSLAVGLQARLSLCSTWVAYERPDDGFPPWTHYSIDLNGIWVGGFVGFYR